jgi:hypothetical protein
MQVIAQILFKIALSLATEEVLKALLATGLEQIVKSTKNDIDNELARPVIDALRK